jgi:hypothetical protein
MLMHAPPHPNPTCRAPFTALPMQRNAAQSVICCYVFKQPAVLINMPLSQRTPPSTLAQVISLAHTHSQQSAQTSANDPSHCTSCNTAPHCVINPPRRKDLENQHVELGKVRVVLPRGTRNTHVGCACEERMNLARGVRGWGVSMC